MTIDDIMDAVIIAAGIFVIFATMVLILVALKLIP